MYMVTMLHEHGTMHTLNCVHTALVRMNENPQKSRGQFAHSKEKGNRMIVLLFQNRLCDRLMESQEQDTGSCLLIYSLGLIGTPQME